MKEIKTLIIEDEVIIAESIKIHLLKMGLENIRMTHDRISAIRIIDEWNPEIVLLDIHLEKEDDGIYLGKLLQTKEIPYMYITANTDASTTIKVLETKPVAYISKPIRFNEFAVNLSLLINKNAKNKAQVLTLSNGTEEIQFYENELKFLRSNGNYIEVHLDSARKIIRNTMDNCLSEISSSKVVRTHRSYAIAIDRIQKITNNSVFIQNEQIPVSRLYLTTLKELVAADKK